VNLKDFRSVVVQFSATFGNQSSIPTSIPTREKEGITESINRRKVAKTGEIIIQPTVNCSVVQLATELERSGFHLVDAYHQIRVDRRNVKRKYHMFRFVFAKSEYAHPSPVILEKREIVRVALDELLASAFWRARAYANPREDGSRGLSINLEARNPRFHPDGKPIKVYQKDENGKKVGEALPLTADFQLLVGDSIRLEKLNIGTEVG